MNKFSIFTIVFIIGCYLNANACTNITLTASNYRLIGHNLDWSSGQGFAVISPVGITRQAVGLSPGQIPLKWTAQYGSITFNFAKANNEVNFAVVTSGMNQVGLVAAALWLEASQYPKPNKLKPSLNNTMVVQYILDNFNSVNQVIAALSKINLVAIKYQGKAVKIHFIVQDTMGNNAIFEYLNGKLVISKGNQANDFVLTNSVLNQSLQCLKQYKTLGGKLNIPIDYHSQARFIRATSLLKQSINNYTMQQAVNYVFSILKNVSEPIKSESPTQWSIVYDTTTKQIFFRTLQYPAIRVINFNEINFANSQPIKILDLSQPSAGDITSNFKPLK